MKKIILFALLLTPLASVEAQDGSAPVKGDSVRGARLFHAYGCYACHGTTGGGGGIAGPRLAPDPLPAAAVSAKLRNASGRMPVYSPAVLSDAEVADLVAYLVSIPPGKPVEAIPILGSR